MNFLNKTKWVLFVLFLCLPSVGNAETTILDCNISSYIPEGNTRTSTLKSWIPEKIFIGIDGGIATVNLLGKKSFSADVKTNDDKTITVAGEMSAIDHKGRKTPMRYSLTYFRSNSKITIYAAPFAYNKLGRAWGKCALSVESASDQVDPESQTSGLDSAKLVRTSGSTDLFLNEKTSTLIIKSSNKWYDKMHSELSKYPSSDIRFSFIWSDDNKKFNKVEFEYLTPEKISAFTDRFVKAFSIRDPRVLRVAISNKKFLYISLTDWNTGTWWVTRTTAVNE